MVNSALLYQLRVNYCGDIRVKQVSHVYYYGDYYYGDYYYGDYYYGDY